MRSTNNLLDLFIEQLEDVYSAEHQILAALPKMIRAASQNELKEALSHHYEETENQVNRLETIFGYLDMNPRRKMCEGMQGIIEEANEVMRGKNKSAILDAAIILAAQKVEHYEMATYGCLRSFAKHLDLDDEVTDLLQDTLDEEGAADKALTKIAEGSFFSDGVNEVAARAKSRARVRAR